MPAPSATPLVMDVSGTGDKIIDLPKHDTGIVHITGNKGNGYFGVKTFDKNNKQIDSIVSTTDPYDGYRLFDNYWNPEATRLQVSAFGTWTIDILAISAIRHETIPGKIIGNGDDLVYVSGGIPDIATVSGNANSHYFGVIGHRGDATHDSLVSVTDPYKGEVMLNTDTVILEILAYGPWEIDITTK